MPTAAPTLVLTDVVPRLQAAGRAVRSTHDAWKAELELRDALVVAAVDHGMSHREIARAADICGTRVIAILIDSQRAD
jgi:hypothetical protein